MLALCWFYCIPLAEFLYFASAPFLLVASLFVLKRGIHSNRTGLRQTAFILMFVSIFKMCMFDIRMLKKQILCGVNAPLRKAGCSDMGFMGAEALGMILLTVLSVALFHYYRVFLHTRKRELKTPAQVGLPVWVNATFVGVLMMVVWQLAPWVGYLTIGRVPDIFMQIPWQHLAILNLLLLTVSFWKSESCVWNYDVTQKKKMDYLNKSWTEKDTLWMTVFIYLITLGLSYVAHDVLT